MDDHGLKISPYLMLHGVRVLLKNIKYSSGLPAMVYRDRVRIWVFFRSIERIVSFPDRYSNRKRFLEPDT